MGIQRTIRYGANVQILKFMHIIIRKGRRSSHYAILLLLMQNVFAAVIVFAMLSYLEMHEDGVGSLATVYRSLKFTLACVQPMRRRTGHSTAFRKRTFISASNVRYISQ